MAVSKLPQYCSIQGCARKSYVRGWCSVHYGRWYKHGDPLLVAHIRGNDVERFWSKVRKTDGCWLWEGWRDKSGYGRLIIKKKGILAHRYSFWLAHGKWPMPTARHTCDNPSCVRPNHIIEGSQILNVADRHERGRDARQQGETHPQAKLNEQNVRDIRSRIGEAGTALAAEYQVTPSLISAIRNGKVWKHVLQETL